MTQPPQWSGQQPQQGQPGQWPGAQPQWQGQPGGYPQQGQWPQGQPGGYPQQGQWPQGQPQPGYPVAPQPGGYPGTPRPGAPQVLPGQQNRPTQVTLAMVLSYVIAVGMLGLGIYILGSGIAGDGSLIVMIPIAAIVGGLGLLNLIGAVSLGHKDFPHYQQAQLATYVPLAICTIGFIRSVTRGAHLDLAFSLGVLVLLAVCVTVLVLTSRPVVREWVRVTHEDSIRRGVVPRNGPRTMNS